MKKSIFQKSALITTFLTLGCCLPSYADDTVVPNTGGDANDFHITRLM